MHRCSAGLRLDGRSDVVASTRSSDPARRGRRLLSQPDWAIDARRCRRHNRGACGTRPGATRGMVDMEIAVVFESMFGATHEVADAIAEGVSEPGPTRPSPACV